MRTLEKPGPPCSEPLPCFEGASSWVFQNSHSPVVLFSDTAFGGRQRGVLVGKQWDAGSPGPSSLPWSPCMVSRAGLTFAHLVVASWGLLRLKLGSGSSGLLSAV